MDLTPDGEMEIVTVDIETTMRDPEGKRSSSNPYYETNKVVAFGGKKAGSSAVMTYHGPSDDIKFNGGPPDKPFILVGHNLKFDLSYIKKRQDKGGYDSWIDMARVWDTQIAEYIISGQTSKFAALGAVGTERGFGAKDDISFTAPEGAQDIDKDVLLKYLERDLELTEQIALQQMTECTEEQFNLILQMGECLKTVVDMEGNGMHVSEKMLIEKLAYVGLEQFKIEQRLQEYCADSPDLLEAKPDWFNSPQVLSCMIFGGTVNYTKKEAVGFYKSGAKKGKVRFRNVEMFQHFPGFAHPTIVGAKKGKVKTKKGEPLYSVDEDTLDLVSKNTVMSDADYAMLHDIIRMRALKKVSTTYYQNMCDMHIDGILHHTLNQCATATGRLSSSSPNLQNVPMAGDDDLLNVKQAFTSRYGNDGMIVEVDFKQLEVCALAWFTKDPQLIKDIRDGVDIHAEIAGQVGMDGSDKRVRRDVKTIVFAMMYGAGSKGIAQSSGLPEILVKSVTKAFYDRYTTIKDFYKALSDGIEEKGTRYDLIHRDGDGNPCPMFEWTSPTGRKYVFKQDPYRPGPAYTQVKNYPVQGTATGDIVPVILGEIGSVLRNAPRVDVCIVNTTHDSVTFDCKDEATVWKLKRRLDKEIFNNVNEIINDKLPGIDWDIPLVVEYEAGPNWGELKALD
jgi:DNA polymerase I-like protein with 3'-5' exonuclease and polymerase domains